MSDHASNTQNSILDAARSEFLEKGFQSASLRNIAKRAGVTTGALYGYYDSKQALFDALVSQQYSHLLWLYRMTLQDFTKLPPENQRNDMQSYTVAGMDRMTEYIYRNLTAFKLILCCSDGTEYEHLIHDLAQMDMEATRDFSETMEKNGVHMNPVNLQLQHMLTSGMFSAYFEMVVHDIPEEDAKTYTDQLLDFYTAGWQKIMGF